MQPTIDRLQELFEIDTSGRLLRRMARAGTPQGKEAGSRHNRGYRAVMVDGTSYLTHCVIFAMTHGRWVAEVDHINGVKDDNRPSNLREATHSQNMFNRKLNANNATGYKGVCIDSRSGKFLAQIRFNKKTKHLGYFDSLSEAVAARRAAEAKYHGEFARAA